MPSRHDGGVENTHSVEPGPRLKIAFVYDALFPFQKGGAERRYAEIAKRLSGRHEVHHFSWTHWDGPAVEERDGIVYHGVGRPPSMYGEDGKRTVREALSFAVRIAPALVRERFDVIDCSATPYLPLYTAWPAARFRGSPLVATWHEYWGEHWRTYLAGQRAVPQAARLLEWGSARFSDSIVAVSDFTAGRIPGRVPRTVVPNGFAVPADPGTWERNAQRVLFTGRLIADKRVDVLIEAFAQVRSVAPGATLRVIGDGPERTNLESLAASLMLGDSIEFLGHVDDDVLWREMQTAAVFALPSIREGFGISMVEGMACGAVPVVARAPHSAAWTLVEDGVSGLVRPPHPEAFAEGLLSLLGDQDRTSAMSNSARIHAAQWHWDAIAERMEAVYYAAAADGARPLFRRHVRVRAPRRRAPMAEAATR